MARTDKLSTYRTAWEHDATRGSVTYIRTRIVAWEGDTVTLNSDGWRTVTTKRKMCQAANQFGLRFCVYQKRGEWFVDIKNPAYTLDGDAPYWQGLAIPYRDGMTFNKYTGALV